MHFAVGVGEVRRDGVAVERRVPLPARWVKVLAEVQLGAAGLVPQ